ncbi:MAG: hypothetical protein B7Z73_14135 [Planctomycetia bacterium 21-64-5]|nr:MAG: hypothetical protein B7Z73_14135 [Planctomycetia bacterium 21-64-5]HQU47035.1 hypothetical protein [Pirellulales bacterium]
MTSFAALPTLHVEGKDDLYTIAGLLERHGVSMLAAQRPFRISTSENPDAKEEGVAALLESMADAIRNATDRPIGFVVDVDVKVADRWQAVCARLREAGLSPPNACPNDGYFGQLENYPHQVGVWLMPDCISDHGTLEHLIKTLIPVGDLLFPHAGKATQKAERLGAMFGAANHNKAVLHCWLAWQERPGVPYGTAINAKFLAHDSPEAIAFLRWLKRLFGLSALAHIA